MTKDQIAHVKRVAEAALSVRVTQRERPAEAFRYVDIFARLMTPEKVIELVSEVELLTSMLNATCGASTSTHDVRNLASAAGFRIVNGQIVAADGGIVGSATSSVTNLISLLRAAAPEGSKHGS